VHEPVSEEHAIPQHEEHIDSHPQYTPQDLGTQNNGQENKATNTKKHPVVELFGPTIQGEGMSAGLQTLFIRFGGCDYRCTRCDSLHAVIPQAVKANATYMTAEEIVTWALERRNTTGVMWITFSGGNPLMHKLETLVALLKELGFFINVETQATLWQDWLEGVDQVTVSPKSPGMGEVFDQKVYTGFINKLVNTYSARMGLISLCVKVVTFSAQDMEFALLVEDCTLLAGWHNPEFYLSQGNPYAPQLGEDLKLHDPSSLDGDNLPTLLLDDFKHQAEDLLQDPRLKRWRFLPQMHVLIWHNEAKR